MRSLEFMDVSVAFDFSNYYFQKKIDVKIKVALLLHVYMGSMHVI